MPQATTTVRAESLSKDTVLLEPAAMTAKDRAPYFTGHVSAVHAVPRSTEEGTGTVMERDIEDIKPKPLSSLKPVVKS